MQLLLLRDSTFRVAGRDTGHAMVALLVALNIMAIMLTIAMPTWNQLTRREKEAELVFRGEQYNSRAIGLYQRRLGPGTLPPDVDVLIEQRFLRKRYQDPITGGDFELLRQGQTLPGQPSAAPTPTPQPSGRGVQDLQGRGGAGAGGLQPTQTLAVGGLQGVVSRSKDKSIRIYNGRNYYNEWQFIFVPRAAAVGGEQGGRGAGQSGRGANPPGTSPERGRGAPAGPGQLPSAPGRGGPGSVPSRGGAGAGSSGQSPGPIR